MAAPGVGPAMARPWVRVSPDAGLPDTAAAVSSAGMAAGRWPDPAQPGGEAGPGVLPSSPGAVIPRGGQGAGLFCACCRTPGAQPRLCHVPGAARTPGAGAGGGTCSCSCSCCSSAPWQRLELQSRGAPGVPAEPQPPTHPLPRDPHPTMWEGATGQRGQLPPPVACVRWM